MKGCIAFAATLLLGSNLSAQVRPLPGPGDPRLQTIEYRDDQVVLIEGSPGYQVMIVFAPDEEIKSVAVGDSGSWQVSANKEGNLLFVKPVAAGSGTNMTVVTSARLYAFDLSASGSSAPYTVQFRYPSPATMHPAAGVTAPAIGRYRLHGSRLLWPSAMSDDGTKTMIEWPESAALPAVYVRDTAGREALANGNMRAGTYVIDSVQKDLVFRLDGEVAFASRYTPRPSK